jgi:hypothetical protein
MRYDGHLRLAHDLGRDLRELLGWSGPLTHRQFTVWTAWLRWEWNRPSRADHYAMQIAKVSLKDNSPGFSSYKIPFEAVKPEPAQRMSREDEIAITKATWFAALGINPPKQKGTQSG